MPLVLERQLVRRAEAFDRRSRLGRDRGEAQDVGFSVRLGAIALHGDHAEYAIGGHDRNDRGGLGTDQLSGLGAVQETDRWTLGGPSLDEARLRRSDDVAREALAERERAAFVLDASVDLADDLHGLAPLVVERE